MFTKNDPGKRWFNGSVGIVEGFDDNSIQVRMLNTTTTHDVERVTWQNTKYKYNKETKEVETVVVGEYTQFPLRWGWAITIHKAQGSTLEDVIIDLNDGGAFATGQLYVALSRAKTLKGIHLRRPILYEDVKVCPAMQDFYNLVGKYESKKTFD